MPQGHACRQTVILIWNITEYCIFFLKGHIMPKENIRLTPGTQFDFPDASTLAEFSYFVW